jgi:hypothetical protein
MRYNRLRSVLSKTLNPRREIAPGLSRWPRQKSPLAVRILPRLLVAFSLTGLALAQPQSQTPPQPQPKSQQSPHSPGAEAPKANADTDDSRPGKVYTDDDVEALPTGDISVVGPATPRPGPAGSAGKASTGSTTAKPADPTGRAAAYWKARFTAARNKLAQDQKTLPVLQSQLDYERVQQYSVDDDTGQVNSDTFMYLLHQIDATKLAIQKDKQALSDLHEEFHRAGGLPGWIR